MATHCLPSTRKEMGLAAMGPPVWKSQSGLPVLASRAKKLPSSEPEKTRPPAVDSTPAHGALCILNSQRIWPVAASSARMAPDWAPPGGCASPPPRSEEHTSELQSLRH